MATKSKSVPLRHASVKGEWKYSSKSFLTSVADGLSDQRHAPAALYPTGNDPPVRIG
jgi:hypothetical protein